MLSLSEPHPLKDLQRIGWIKLKAGTDLQEAVKTLSEPLTDDFLVVTTPHRPTRARYTHEIANTEARIHADHELAVELAKVCDSSLIDPEEEEDDEAEEVVYDGVSLVQARLRDVILENEDASMEEGNQEDAAQATIRRANEVCSPPPPKKKKSSTGAQGDGSLLVVLVVDRRLFHPYLLF